MEQDNLPASLWSATRFPSCCPIRLSAPATSLSPGLRNHRTGWHWWKRPERGATANSGRQSIRHRFGSEGLGIRPGDRVMVVCENCRASVAIFLALGAMDAWPVLVNARLSAQEIDQIRDHCGARRLIYTAGVSVHARKHAQRHGATVEDIPGLGLLGIGPLYEDVRPEPLEANPADNVGALIYTSGTTGRPKGVMLTHRNLLFAANVSSKIRALTPADRMYGVLPISHVAGLTVVMLATLLSGASLHLSARFDPTGSHPQAGTRKNYRNVGGASAVCAAGRLCESTRG